MGTLEFHAVSNTRPVWSPIPMMTWWPMLVLLVAAGCAGPAPLLGDAGLLEGGAVDGGVGLPPLEPDPDVMGVSPGGGAPVVAVPPVSRFHP
jgi:hypothetical protein